MKRRRRSTASIETATPASSLSSRQALAEKVLGEGIESVATFYGRTARRADIRPALPARESRQRSVAASTPTAACACSVRRRTRTACAASSPPTTSRSTTAPASSTSRPAFGAEDFAEGKHFGMLFAQPIDLRGHDGGRTSPARASSPSRRTRTSSQDLEDRGLHAQERDASSTPTRSAGAATRRCSTTRSRAGTSRTRVSSRNLLEGNQAGQLVPGPPQERPLRQLAREQHRLGLQPRALLGHAAAILAAASDCGHDACIGSKADLVSAPSIARRRRRSTTSTGRTSTRSSSLRCEASCGVARRSACPRSPTPGSIAAPCPTPSGTTRSRTSKRSTRPSPPTSSAKRSTRPAAGSTRSTPRLRSSRRPKPCPRTSLQERHLRRPHPGREGQQDVQVPGQRGRTVARAR